MAGRAGEDLLGRSDEDLPQRSRLQDRVIANPPRLISASRLVGRDIGVSAETGVGASSLK
jgi:hypothetical protein